MQQNQTQTKKSSSRKNSKMSMNSQSSSKYDAEASLPMAKQDELRERIKGWGADLDPANRPGVPKDKKLGIGADQLYPNIEPQVSDVTVFKSVEHLQMPPVFGTTCPPKGLSGVMRKFAFKFNEAEFAHWLTLLAADRVDMVEHVFADLARGHVPNLWKEMGLSAELKYNRKNFLTKVAVAGLGVAAVAGVFALRQSSRNRTTANAKLV